MNFPANHPLYLPGYPREVIEAADAILLLDIDVPWSPSIIKIRKDAKILQIDIDPVKSGFPLWGFPVDLSVQASSAVVIPELLNILKHRSGESRLSTSQKVRKKKIESCEKKIGDSLRAGRTGKKVPSMWRLCSLRLTMHSPPKRLWCLRGSRMIRLLLLTLNQELPESFFALGGKQFGRWIGECSGPRLASPKRDVVCIVSDGGYVYSNPTSVFWASRKYNLPILTVIINNGGYRAMKSSVERAFPQGFSKQNNIFAGFGMNPSPDFIMTAKACGASGVMVRAVEDLSEVLKRGLQDTRTEKKSFVIDAIVDQV